MKSFCVILLLIIGTSNLLAETNPYAYGYNGAITQLEHHYYRPSEYLKFLSNLKKRRDYKNFFIKHNNPNIDTCATLMLARTLDNYADPIAVQKEIAYFFDLFEASKFNNHILATELIHLNIKKRLNINPIQKKVVINAISEYIQTLCKQFYQDFAFQHDKPDMIKFINVRTGNDLFSATSMLPKSLRTQSMTNYDMDYTGSLLAEIGTDYLRLRSKKPKLTYQTFLFGFDVHTPYFRDTSIFTKNDTFNIKDRPHGSFLYGGFSFNGLSATGGYKWRNRVKIGKIGSNVGKVFQDVLHQDISTSPPSLGWPSQIANTGRVGFSFEHRSEFLITHRKLNFNSKKYVPYASLITQVNFGSYKTNLGIGYSISNTSLSKMNMHNVRLINPQGKTKLTYKIEATYTYNQHNSMLEGYGWLRNNLADSCLQPLNKFYLKRNQIRPFIFLTEFHLGLSTPNFTAFYIHSIRSPELRSSVKSATSEGGVDLFVNKWFSYGTLGLSFHGF